MEVLISVLGKYLVPLLVGIGAVFGLSFMHTKGVRNAAGKARDDERKRIETEAMKEAMEVKEEADEKRREIDSYERTELRRRMRDAARSGDGRMRVDPPD